MTTPDVPAAERERDKLREQLWHLTRDPGPLGSAVCALLNMDDDELYVELDSDEVGALLALLAPHEARGPNEPEGPFTADEDGIVRDANERFVAETRDTDDAYMIAYALNHRTAARLLPMPSPGAANEPGCLYICPACRDGMMYLHCDNCEHDESFPAATAESARPAPETEREQP